MNRQAGTSPGSRATARSTERRPRGHRNCPVRAGASGLISADWCSDHFARTLRDIDLDQDPAATIKALTLFSTPVGRHRFDVVFTPFDLAMPSAKVLIVGITPGQQQWRLAVEAAQRCLRRGETVNRMLGAASRSGGFAGSMRTNLVTMLDAIGVHKALDLSSCSTMFDLDNKLMDGTSALTHAIFKDGTNYTGHGPTFDRIPILTAFVDQVLAANLRMIPNALIVPLGLAANEAVARAADVADIDPTRILQGFPHPSGANGGRVRQFAQARRKLRREVRQWQISVLE